MLVDTATEALSMDAVSRVVLLLDESPIRRSFRNGWVKSTLEKESTSRWTLLRAPTKTYRLLYW